MYRSISVVLIFVIMFSACSLFQGDSYSGEWNIIFSGDMKNEAEFVVNDDNKFEFELMVTVEGRTFPVIWRGEISEDGELKGGIYLESERVGSFKGACDFEKGEGTWRGGNYNGEWSALKL